MTTPTQQPKIPTPNNIQECLTIQAHFIGIPKITKKNYVEFYERGKALQLLGVGWVTKEVDSTMEENQGRMPNLDEVEANIGIVESNAPRFDKKQWKDPNTSDEWKKNNLNIIKTRLNGWQLDSFVESYENKVNKKNKLK